ncbi:glycoside hydrolase family 172 protein [Paenibacillus sp. Soil750]|uniref:glycoside hydrolase family 172 protein n=1 Tax=Paenibacillus sp. Soil750 TaxID=1736398 RepID=UPI0006FB9AD4|nr:glycoside hydrolase family 172 protein [Paenibacillus sp. Soil750]KRE69462.1 hypothetical protein ASL11_13750 [Paenibacillus sp. Soil750]
MGLLDGLYRFQDCKTFRVSSYDRSGGNDDYIKIKPGETAVLAEMHNAGIIKHIWITINAKDPMYNRNLILRMYWDGESEPSVQSPIGDFFGQGWGEHYLFASLPMAAAPAGGRGLNCYFPMPFSDGAKITLENDSESEVPSFYYYIDYEEHASIPDDAGRFHAWWNREITEPSCEQENEWGLMGEPPKNQTDEGNYLFAEIEGRGHFVGVNYYVDSPGPMWYGEGDDMFMVDGEPWPGSLHGTGTEDFFNSSWCPNELYAHPYFGYARIPDKLGFMGRTHCYRFLLEDSIHFRKSLRSSIEHGHANVLTLDIASVAYWYQSEPHKAFPAIPQRSLRQNMPVITASDVHRWRDAWRKSKGSGKLWGNELE